MNTTPKTQQVALFIADAETRAWLQRALRDHLPQVEVVACCGTISEAMRTSFSSHHSLQRVVFVDEGLFAQGPHLMRLMDSDGLRGDCVLLLQKPDFAQLLSALRNDTADCITAPFSVDEIKAALDRIARRHARRNQSMPVEAVEASRYLFWRNDVRRLSVTRMTIAQTNKEYGTRFSEGLFRALFIEMSCQREPSCVIDNRELQDSITRLVIYQLSGECFDVLFNRHSNGVSVLLNFSFAKRNTVTNLIDQLFFALKDAFGGEAQIEITMSIGRVYTEFAMLPEVKQEILDARWSRKRVGSGGIINAEDIKENNLSMKDKRKILNDRDLILHYIELLDIKRASLYIEQFYRSYMHVVSSRELRLFTTELLDFLFHSYSNELLSYGDLEVLRHSYINRAASAHDLESYARVALANSQDIMQKIEVIVRRQYSQPIKDCMAYISTHHCRHIRLTDLADRVHLTPQYLSSRFHKETGATLSEYIKEQKLSLAKIMLTHSDKNISEIADFLGFADVRYFSKFFKLHRHVTPTEYRRLKQATASYSDRQ